MIFVSNQKCLSEESPYVGTQTMSASLLVTSCRFMATRGRQLRSPTMFQIASPRTQLLVPHAFSTGPSVNDADVNRVPAVYTAYTVYKSKGAVSFKIIKPTWDRAASGIRLSREGTMLLEFATGSGDRSYAWGSKGTFGLSASEIGDFLAAVDANEEWSAFHDPNMGGSSRGAVILQRPAAAGARSSNTVSSPRSIRIDRISPGDASSSGGSDSSRSPTPLSTKSHRPSNALANASRRVVEFLMEKENPGQRRDLRHQAARPRSSTSSGSTSTER